ncbi:YciI family protein [Undibacterium sp.]|uniref:YciI family protein n=1 Tax=Undibacterium sp. TaxID=1914977 RepID=UPI002D175539|nr:YciI family protein [Undibacterium sp.]HTD05916.1 YciI family protein [Undibacterium sp.]
MIIRKADQATEAGSPPSAGTLAAMAKYSEELEAAGAACAGLVLHPSSKGVRMHFRDGEQTMSEGPFTEEKELVAGFAMMEAESQQEAIAWLKRWPAQDNELTLEVRGSGCPGGLEGVSLTRAAADTEQRRFVVMLKSSPLAETGAIPSDKVLAAMAGRNAEGVQAGVMIAGEGLQITASGARVKFSGGKSTVLDGPFSETKELIAGYWLIQAKSMAGAIDWVKRYPYPFIEDAQVEIRPVQEGLDVAAAVVPGIARARKSLPV